MAKNQEREEQPFLQKLNPSLLALKINRFSTLD
jgi:hypothetical protein